MNEITESDWVIYRLLYLILAIDPRMATVDDVSRAIRYTKGDTIKAFDLIKQEHGKLDTFNQIGTNLIRNLQNTVDVHREYIDEEDKEFMQRRVFGLSKAKYSNGVIQDILDRINLDMGEKNGR